MISDVEKVNEWLVRHPHDPTVRRERSFHPSRPLYHKSLDDLDAAISGQLLRLLVVWFVQIDELHEIPEGTVCECLIPFIVLRSSATT